MSTDSSITKDKLSRFFDHTHLMPFATNESFRVLCEEALKYNFAMVAINSYPVKFCKDILRGSDVHVGAAISFPLGATTIDTKLFEIEKSIKDGADEIDYVINITELKNKNYAYIKLEMDKIVSMCRGYNVLSKVIFENCYLEKSEIEILSNIAKEVKPNFIKTSTGFAPSGANIEDVRFMKSIVEGADVLVKASGGIKTLSDCINMIDAGVSRIGCSNSVNILKELD